MTNEKIIEKLGYIKVLVARESNDLEKREALDSAIDIISGLDKFYDAVQTYEADCQLTADGHCNKCNETLFQSIYRMIESSFGSVDGWHNSKKGE